MVNENLFTIHHSPFEFYHRIHPRRGFQLCAFCFVLCALLERAI